MCGTRAVRAAPTSWATMELMAIMMPSTVTRTMDQIEAPSETAASSSALAWPLMATSATPMPTLASWPISIGQARRHRELASARMAETVRAVVWGMAAKGG